MKPTLKKFTDAVQKAGGNLTKVAEFFKTSRQQVYRWIKADDSFKGVVLDARMRLFDECLGTARIVALGVPDIVDGKMTGWLERPDSNMLRYLIGTLGRNEGFGESIDITSKGDKITPTISIQPLLTADELEQIKKEIQPPLTRPTT